MPKSLILMFVAMASGPLFAAAPGYLAYGDLRGHIEPCGCDPATDLGGIKRLGAVIQRERALNPGLALFSLGNNVSLEAKDAVKNPFFAEVDATLGVTAALVNVFDIRQAKALAARPAGGPPLVLSNAKPRWALKDRVKVSAAGNDYLVFGYTYHESVKADVRRVDDTLLKEWRESAKGNSILLFSGPQEDLDRIAKAKIFGAIVSSNTQPFEAETSTLEKDDEARLRRSADPVVMMVPHGGQGILRGGSLLYSEAKPVSEFFKKEETKPKGMELPFPKAKLVTWLDPASAPEDGPLKGIYERYTAAAREKFLGEGQSRLKDLATSPYAGSKVCATCHAAAAEVYAKSAHARAMATLQAKGKHEDPECVSCHSVGAGEKGGFVSVEASPNLANVQCENCHLPRLAHAKDPGSMPKAAAAGLKVCETCHNSQHSPKFNATDYWKSISHR